MLRPGGNVVRNVEIGQIFNREMIAFLRLRESHDLIKHAVDAESHSKRLFLGFGVDVAGPFCMAFPAENKIDDLDMVSLRLPV